MKLFTLSALLLVGTCLAELRRDDVWPPKMVIEFLTPIRNTCMEKTGVTAGNLNTKLATTNFFLIICFYFITAEAIKEFSDGELHDDPKLKCYMNCIFVEAKAVDDNGDVHFEKIETHVEKLDEEIRDIAKNFLANCKNIQGSDPCERAFSVHKCWKLHDPKVNTNINY